MARRAISVAAQVADEALPGRVTRWRQSEATASPRIGPARRQIRDDERRPAALWTARGGWPRPGGPGLYAGADGGALFLDRGLAAMERLNPQPPSGFGLEKDSAREFTLSDASNLATLCASEHKTPEHDDMQGFPRMARPGLEPGTPRFSDTPRPDSK